MRFAPHTDDDVAADARDARRSSSVDDLFDQIPPGVRLDRPLDIPAGVSEMELVATCARWRPANRTADELVCFAGGGAYDHYVPRVVWALAGRSEFSTSYTPYQPELSQGVLQALFEFQSMICELTALEVSNASLYDGATALVEAVDMTRGHGRDRVLVSGARRPPAPWTRFAPTAGERGTSPRSSTSTDGRGGAPDVGPTWRRSSCSTRTSTGSSRTSRAVRPRHTTGARARSRSSTRCPSACWRRPASSAPTSRWGRGSPSATT